MLKVFWLNAATVFMQLRECMIVKRKRIESTEEVVADLHTYLEQLHMKCGELENKVQKCNQRALFHKQKASQQLTSHAKQREINRAKMYLQDKHRLLDDQDRTLRFMHLIRHQIDSLTSSHMDNIMVDAMRQYNLTAQRMGLPDRSKDIDNLSRDLQEHFAHVSELQKLLTEATDPTGGCGILKDEEEEELMLELEALGGKEEEVEKDQAASLSTGLRQRQPSLPLPLSTVENNMVTNTEPEPVREEPQKDNILIQI